MKNSTIKLIVWSVIALLILAIGVTLFLTPSILNNLHIELPFSTVYHYSNADAYSVGAGSADGVKSIVVDWVDGKVNIVPYEGTVMEFSEESSVSLTEEQQLHWFNDNGTLRLHSAASGVRLLTSGNKTLTLKIPKELALEKLDLDVVSARTSVGTVKVGALSVDTVSGEVLAGGSFDSVKINTVSGSVRIDGACDSVKTDTVSGEVFLTFRTPDAVPGKIDSDSVSGSLNVYLPEGTGFTADISSVSGNISTDFAMTQMKKNHVVSGDGALSIDAESVSGDLEIRVTK